MSSLNLLKEKGLLESVSLKKVNSYRMEGTTRYFLEANTQESVIEALDFAKAEGLPLLLLGNGSNLLFDNHLFEGLVLKIGREICPVSYSEGVLEVPAGMPLNALVKRAHLEGSYALDYLLYIPGNVGGSIVNNAGAFGQDICDSLLYIEGFNEKGEYLRLNRSEIRFSYRKCELRGKFTILKAGFTLQGANQEDALRWKELNRYRKETQPTQYPSSGCVFKNPNGDSAGRLIDKSGCKRLRSGDAQVSELHANFIVNLGKARPEDVIDLVKQVQSRVEKSFGVELERELQYSSEAYLKVG